MMNEKNSQKEHSSAEQNQCRNNQEVVVINYKKNMKVHRLEKGHSYHILP